MKKVVLMILFLMAAIHVQAVYLLVDGIALEADNPIYLHAGTHVLTWGGTETTNPTPGERWNNGVIYIDDIDGGQPDYYFGQAGFDGTRTWQSAAGAGAWATVVGGSDSDETRVCTPTPEAGDWYVFGFTYDGQGPVKFEAGYYTDEALTVWTSLVSGEVRPMRDSAINVYPADGTCDVSSEVTFSWNTGHDPNNPENRNPKITKHYFYLDGPYALGGGDPNFAEVTPVEVAGGSDPINYGPVTVAQDVRYYWRVDESISDSNPNDPNTVIGSTWWFETRTVPDIITQPESVYVYIGDDAALYVEASDPLEGILDYQWYKGISGDTTIPVGTNSATLTLTNIQTSAYGSYWCRISNANSSIDSASAGLYQAMLIAYWPLNSSSADPNYIEDITGNGFDGMSTAALNYVSGKLDNAAEIPEGDYISIGQVMDRPEQFSVSAWVKTDAAGAILSLRDTLNMTFSCFEIENGNDGLAGALRYGQWDDETFEKVTTTATINDNQWHHVAVAYDGGEVTLYIDGLMQTCGVLSNNEYSASANEFLIASNEWGVYIFEGLLDDIRFYNHAMTKAQVAEVYLETEDYICVGELQYDLNHDCSVDLEDFALMVTEWLDCSQQYGNPDCPDVVLP